MFQSILFLSHFLSAGISAAEGSRGSVSGISPQFAEMREWEPIRPRDYWIDGFLVAGAFAAYNWVEPQSGSWSEPSGIDKEGRRLLRFSSRSQRKDAGTWSNVTLTGAIAAPVLFDGLLLPWQEASGSGRWKRAARIWNINLQAFALTAVLTGTTKALIGRERPFDRECRMNPSSDPGCSQRDPNESFKSFYSGHSVYAFTGAGLACLHHQELRPFGDWRDQGICLSAVALATSTAVLRVSADRHYLSDISTGALVGFISGYLFPKLMHSTQTTDSGRMVSYWLPMIEPDGGGLQKVIYF